MEVGTIIAIVILIVFVAFTLFLRGKVAQTSVGKPLLFLGDVSSIIFNILHLIPIIILLVIFLPLALKNQDKDKNKDKK